MKISIAKQITKTSWATKALMIVLLLSPFILVGGQCNPNNPPIVIPLGTNAMRLVASVEGDFAASDASAVDGGTFVTVNASMPHGTGLINVQLQIPKQANPPYTVSVGTDAVPLISYCVSPDNATCHQFFARKGTGSGTITISQLTPTVKGTFSGQLKLVPTVGTDVDRTISDGEFNAGF
ncbi:MAG: hypothetical protein ABI444_14325 [Candidatus Kapaibacterium sp.]|jgi:hypothetical protein